LELFAGCVYAGRILVAALLGTQIAKPAEDTFGSLGLALLLGLVIAIVTGALPFVGVPVRFLVVLTGLGLLVERVHAGWRATHGAPPG
jgi:hypothetical protein